MIALSSVPHVVLAALVLLAAAGCSESNPVAPLFGNAATVRLFNDSPFTMKDVRVTVAPNVDVLESSLAPGELSSAHPVTAIYASPAVSLSADNKTLIASPVEGFTGYNALLASGAYVVSIHIADRPPILRITVTQPIANQRP